MKSFKKIALGLVAAMALSTIIATPASAAPMSVTSVKKGATAGGVTTWTTTALGTAAGTPITLTVPADNSVDAADVVEFVVTVDTGTAVSVVTANASVIAAVATVAAPVTAASGSSSWSQNVGTGTTATFYVFTKTSAVGTVTITNGGTTLTYYVQGTVGKINSLTLTGVDSAAAGTAVALTATAYDVFGNKISGKGLTAIANGAALTATTGTTGTGLTDFGSVDFKFTAPATGPVTVVAYATTSTDVEAEVTGFNTPKSSVVKIVGVRDLAAELAAEKAAHDATKAAAAKAATDAATAAAKATADAAAAKAAADSALATANAEIAKLKADAALATAANAKALADFKVAFNALAKKWNAKNPKAKVTYLK